MADVVVRGLVQTLVFAPAWLILAGVAFAGVAGARAAARRMAFKAVAGWGKVTWWRRVRLYHIEAPPV
jgi:hypothetical protein